MQTENTSFTYTCFSISKYPLCMVSRHHLLDHSSINTLDVNVHRNGCAIIVLDKYLVLSWCSVWESLPDTSTCRNMWLIVFVDWGVDYCAKDVGCEMKTLTGSDDPQSLLVGKNWNLCVDRIGRGYSVTVQSGVLGPCCYPTEQFCPQRFYLT